MPAPRNIITIFGWPPLGQPGRNLMFLTRDLTVSIRFSPESVFETIRTRSKHLVSYVELGPYTNTGTCSTFSVFFRSVYAIVTPAPPQSPRCLVSINAAHPVARNGATALRGWGLVPVAVLQRGVYEERVSIAARWEARGDGGGC